MLLLLNEKVCWELKTVTNIRFYKFFSKEEDNIIYVDDVMDKCCTIFYSLIYVAMNLSG